jgi:hypothetical protein
VNNVAHWPRPSAAPASGRCSVNTNTRYLHDEVLRYASRITATLPEPLSVCFCNRAAGQRARDLVVRAATGAHDMVRGARLPRAVIDVSPWLSTRGGGRGAPSWVHAAAMFDHPR